MKKILISTNVSAGKVSVFIFALILFAIMLGLIVFQMSKPKSDFWYQIYQERTELKYWSSKDSLVTAIDNYIITTAPESTVDGLFLLNKCQEYNVDLVFVLAQATLESQFGTTGMAKKTNSVFNVGAYDGESSHTISSKYKYENPNLSIDPYLTLLNDSYLEGKSEEELLNNFVNKHGKRYASYKNYEKELQIIIKSIEETTDIAKAYSRFLKYQNLSNR